MHLEPGLQDARILTFGYKAPQMSRRKAVFDISDFSRDLLFKMKFGSDENANPLGIGKVSRKTTLPRPTQPEISLMGHSHMSASCRIRRPCLGWPCCQEGKLSFASLSLSGMKI